MLSPPHFATLYSLILHLTRLENWAHTISVVIMTGSPKPREYGNPGMAIFTGCVNFYDTSWFGLPSQVCKSGAFTVMPDQLSAVEVTSVKAPPPYQACVHGMCMAYFTQTSTKYNPVLNYRIYSGVPDSSCFPLRVVALVIWTDCNNYF